MKLQTSQFWVCKFRNEEHAGEILGEDDAFYDEANEECDPDDKTPLSKFIGTQGQWWFDHDWIEWAFNSDTGTASERFLISWVNAWGSELDKRLIDGKIDDFNTVVSLLVIKNSDGSLHRQVQNPRSFEGSDFQIHYLGEIEYDGSY